MSLLAPTPPAPPKPAPHDPHHAALAAALPLLALSACQTIYPVPNVEFPTATAPAMPARGPLVMAAYEPHVTKAFECWTTKHLEDFVDVIAQGPRAELHSA